MRCSVAAPPAPPAGGQPPLTPTKPKVWRARSSKIPTSLSAPAPPVAAAAWHAGQLQSTMLRAPAPPAGW
jgi:hypothetical protein